MKAISSSIYKILGVFFLFATLFLNLSESALFSQTVRGQLPSHELPILNFTPGARVEDWSLPKDFSCRAAVALVAEQLTHLSIEAADVTSAIIAERLSRFRRDPDPQRVRRLRAQLKDSLGKKKAQFLFDVAKVYVDYEVSATPAASAYSQFLEIYTSVSKVQQDQERELAEVDALISQMPPLPRDDKSLRAFRRFVENTAYSFLRRHGVQLEGVNFYDMNDWKSLPSASYPKIQQWLTNRQLDLRDAISRMNQQLDFAETQYPNSLILESRTSFARVVHTIKDQARKDRAREK